MLYFDIISLRLVPLLGSIRLLTILIRMFVNKNITAFTQFIFYLILSTLVCFKREWIYSWQFKKRIKAQVC